MSYIDIIFIAFGMGLLGSIHCIGMCGPLVLGIFNQSLSSKPYNYLLYHLGKIMAYGSIGFGFGLVGKSIHLFLSQQQLSLLTGTFLLLYYVVGKWAHRLPELSVYTTGIYQWIKVHTEQMPLPKYYLLGFLNGFLPCGLVYLAATSSLSSGHITKSIVWMIGFGLGTIPSLTFILWVSKKFQSRFSHLFQIIYQNLTLILAILLILRGLNLGIPLISPQYSQTEERVSKCCHN
jgi:sulfite exporter TauE/SafE